MIKSGTLNADGTVTPVNGALEIKKLTGGQKYRFVERANPNGYLPTKIDATHHNDASHFTVANSRAVDVKNTGKGQVINMYNAKLPGITIEGKKELDGRTLQNGEFHFQLFEKASNAKVGSAVSNDAQGKFKKALTFDREGTYEFYFAEVNDGKHGITYDNSKVPVTIVVSKNAQGVLKATITSGEISFNNKFTPKPVNPNQRPGKPSNPNTGDYTNLMLFVILLALASSSLFTVQFFRRKNR